MLKQRIITALILIPIAISGIFLLPPVEFAIFVGAVLTIAAWEWANLAGYEGYARFVYAAVIAALLAGAYWLPPMVPLIAGIAWWCVALVLVVRYPNLTRLWSTVAVRACLGVVILIPGFVSLVQLKALPESDYWILLLFFLIWGADVGAYFAGRAFGQRKLAPLVSPGKSWAGLYGGLVAALLVVIGMSMARGTPELGTGRGAVFLAVCTFVALVSVLGDLSESMFKRQAGAKDSGTLLPGHGGVLDRIDSLLSAGPFFALFILAYRP